MRKSALPTVKYNKYDVTLDELGKTVKYRPFTVKEHKLLLQAIELQDERALVNCIRDIVEACTFGELDLDKLPVHIVDYLYLQIHSKSTGSIQTANYNCNNPVLQEDQTMKPCGSQFALKVNIEDAVIVYPEGYNEMRTVMVDDEVGIRLRVPNFEDFKKIDLKSPVLDIADRFIFSCIENIFSSDTVIIPGVDFTPEDAIEWLNALDGSVMEKISEFFKVMPYLGLKIPVTCPNCGKKEVVELQGLEDFFG